MKRPAPLNHDPRAADLRKVERLADLLDARFRIPGIGIRVGYDGLLGLIPGVGDTLTLVPSLWMVFVGWRHDLPWHSLARMLGNAALDYAVGGLPAFLRQHEIAYEERFL